MTGVQTCALPISLFHQRTGIQFVVACNDQTEVIRGIEDVTIFHTFDLISKFYFYTIYPD